ncbi:MAG: aldehyde dehydrogenase family protein [Parvularculaceae bacterium]
MRAYHERTGTVERDRRDAQALSATLHGVLAARAAVSLSGASAERAHQPALIAGNTIALKPLEPAPGPGAFIVRAMEEAGVPKGAINLVQGAQAGALAGDDRIDGLLHGRREDRHRASQGVRRQA